MAQVSELKKKWIDLESPVIESLKNLEIPGVEEISIEKEIKKGKQVKLKKFNKLLSKITKKSKYNAYYTKELVSIRKISSPAVRRYAVY